MASNAENVSIWWRHHVFCFGHIISWLQSQQIHRNHLSIFFGIVQWYFCTNTHNRCLFTNSKPYQFYIFAAGVLFVTSCNIMRPYIADIDLSVWYKTKFGSQNFGYQICFCTRLLIVPMNLSWGKRNFFAFGSLRDHASSFYGTVNIYSRISLYHGLM